MLSFADGRAEVEIVRGTSKSTSKYSLDKIRYPNGEGQWATWKDKHGKLNVAARFIARDEENVMIRTAEGKEITLPIKDLALNLKQRVKATPITGMENAVNGVVPFKIGDKVQVEKYSDWHDGVIESIEIGEVEVKYIRSGRDYTDKFNFAAIRFPNGEWAWEKWKDADGLVDIEARFIGRDDTEVTLLRADGSQVKLPIEDLDSQLKRRALAVRETAKMNHIDGADPVRPGDQVQISKSNQWFDGVVTKMNHGTATVEFFDSRYSKTYSEDFAFAEIRFPNGEGKWREWKSAKGDFSVVARYISRTETHVTIRKHDGTDLTVDKTKLSSELRRILSKTPITGKETLIDGVNPIRIGDLVEVQNRYGKSTAGRIAESHRGHAMIEFREAGSDKVEKKLVDFKDIVYPNGEGRWRKWRDKDGGSEMIGRFIRRSSKDLTLMTEDGNFLTMPIERLSRKLQKEAEKTPVVAMPPEMTDFATAPNSVSFLSKPPSFQEFVITDVAPTIAVEGVQGGMGIAIKYGDEISDVVPLNKLPSESATDKPWYAVGTYASTYFKGQRWTQLYWACPSKEKFEVGPAFRSEERIVDYSADQKRLLNLVFGPDGREPIGFRTYRVEPLSLDAEPEFAWDAPTKMTRIYGGSSGSSFKAELVNENQLLLSSSNAISLYDFEKKKIIYTIPSVRSGHFVLHPSKRFFAVRLNGVVSLVDVASGKQLAAHASNSAAGVGFSQDGRKVVVVDSKIHIWDLQATTVPLELRRRNLLSRGSAPIEMIDDNWIKGGEQLYSVAKEVVVWSYTGSGVKMKHSEMLGKLNLLAGTKRLRFYDRAARKFNDTNYALVGLAEVPHAPALEALDKLQDVDMLMLKKGSGVRIEASGDPRIREGVLRAIQESNWHEDPNSVVTIRASAGYGESQTKRYGTYRSRTPFSVPRPFGRFSTPDSLTTVNFSPWQQRVEFMYEDKIAWSTSRSGYAPSSFNMENGETVQSAINKYNKPTYAMFESLTFPADVIYPDYRNGLGRTSITVGGFVDKLYAEVPEELEAENEDEDGENPDKAAE